jgi:hypothetical protein
MFADCYGIFVNIIVHFTGSPVLGRFSQEKTLNCLKTLKKFITVFARYSFTSIDSHINKKSANHRKDTKILFSDWLFKFFPSNPKISMKN